MQAVNNTKLAVFLIGPLKASFYYFYCFKETIMLHQFTLFYFPSLLLVYIFCSFLLRTRNGGKEREEDRTVLRTTYGVYQKYIPQYPLHLREETKQAE